MKKNHRKDREIKREEILLTGQTKVELNIIELKNNLELLKDGLDEKENRFVVKNTKFNSLNQRFREDRKYNETNPFDFTDIFKDNDINLKQFLDFAENNVVLYKNEPISKIKVNAGKDKYSFLIKRDITINGEEKSRTNRLYKDVEKPTKTIEKRIH